MGGLDDARSGLSPDFLFSYFLRCLLFVICMRLLIFDVMEREKRACPLVRHPHIQQMPNTVEFGVSVFRRGLYRRKTKYRLPSTKLPSCPCTAEFYRHFWFYRFCQVGYRLKTTYRPPSTKLPSCPIYRRDITGIFGFTVCFRQTGYRKKNKYRLPSAKPPAKALPSRLSSVRNIVTERHPDFFVVSQHYDSSCRFFNPIQTTQGSPSGCRQRKIPGASQG